MTAYAMEELEDEEIEEEASGEGPGDYELSEEEKRAVTL